MSDKDKEYRIFISAAEQSGETHCAHLIGAIKQQDASVEFVGTGGPKMEAAGCRLFESTVDQATMGYNAFAEVGYYWKLVRRIRDYFQQNRVDLVVLCDSHAYNIHVAKAARKAGIPTLFYVAPQYWAWAEWRIHKLRRCCDRLCCILPFEEQWFTERGIAATFVSNPLLDDVSTDLSPCVKDYAGFDPRRVKVALIPGSRKAEIEILWQPMQEIALALKRRYPEAELTAVAASPKRAEALRKAQLPGLACRYTVDSVRDTALQSDFALVTSGSATLEVASAGCPLIVMYQMSRILWHGVGRWLVKSKLLSLVNLLADRHLVPEFMPYFSSVDPIIAKAIEMIDAPQALARLSQDLIGITQPLAAKRTRDEVASIALEMLRSRA